MDGSDLNRESIDEAGNLKRLMGEYGVATERNSWSAWLVGGLAVCTVVTGAGFGVYKGIRSSNRPVAVCETVHVQPPDCKL